MKKVLLIIALFVSGLGLNAQNDGDLVIATPTNLKAEAVTFSKIKLSWDAVNDTVEYKVYSDDKVVGRTSETSCEVDGLEPLTEYCFTVAAVYNDTESEKSEEACATTPEELICLAPENVKANVVLNDPNYHKKYKITITWDAVENAELYAVYAASANVPDGIWVGDAPTNEFVIGIDLEGELYFSVKTVCDAANVITSERSEEVNVILSEDIGVNGILPPSNVKATVKTLSSIELTWDAAEGANSYFIYRDGEEIANIKETTYLDENLKADTKYCYVITSMGVDSESDPSEEVCETIKTDGVEEMSSSFNIYPNPVGDELFITTEMNVTEVAIYDIYGRQAMSQQVNKSTSQQVVNVADLDAGVYFVKVVTSEGDLVKRFVKE